MTANTSPTTNRSSSPRRYRIAMYGFLAVGFVGYIAGLRVDAPLAALGIYWVGFLGFLGVWKGSSVTLYDERHEALEAEAMRTTFGVIGAVLILVGPALPAVLDAGYEVPSLALGALYGYGAMFGVYMVASIAVRIRS
ncbi:hypothetical protein KY092_15100 [Natronomonas gomsonensis]|uniref:hypothetical protein n=1 Tax=Natronomonas gomsonensis TaxID=1046043 RepID=UPI0020CA362E|nr:hypothetical protein [Natronomonas gomsonensis]MCY4731886.1 hypothetical protein [Natronomonas gomsonensis]